jgi:hypothetical protein
MHRPAPRLAEPAFELLFQADALAAVAQLVQEQPELRPAGCGVVELPQKVRA